MRPGLGRSRVSASRSGPSWAGDSRSARLSRHCGHSPGIPGSETSSLPQSGHRTASGTPLTAQVVTDRLREVTAVSPSGTGGPPGTGWLRGRVAPGCDDAEEVLHFVVYVIRARHRLGDLRAQQLPEALAQAVHGGFHGGLRRPELDRHVAVGRFGLLAGQEALEPRELPRPVRVFLLTSQSGERSLEHGQRPAPLVDLLRGQALDGFVAIAALDVLDIERDDAGPPAALPRLCLLALFREEVLDRRLQVRPEASARRVVVVEVPLLEELREVGLGEVARLLRVVTLPPDEGVARIPVDATEGLEGLSRLRRRRVARREDLRPTGRRKPCLHRGTPLRSPTDLS